MELKFLQFWVKNFSESWKKSWNKLGMWGIIFPAFASLITAIIKNPGKPLSEIFTEDWIFYGLVFIGLYIFIVCIFVLTELVIVYNKQQKKIQNLLNKFETRNAKIEIGEYHFPSYGQATKVGIFVDNNDIEDLFPKVKIVGDITRSKQYNNNVEIDSILLDNSNRIIDFKEKIDFRGFGNISIVEVQGEHVVLVLEKKLLLASLKDVLDVDSYEWSFNFEIFGSKNSTTFENGLYSVSIVAKQTPHEIYLRIGEIMKVN